MTYKEIFDMVAVTAYNRFPKGFNYEGLQNCIVENATKIYIEQMRLEKEKLQQEYDDLYEGHENLTCDWVRLKKENKELYCKYDDLNKKCNELFNVSGKINNELSKELINLKKEHQDLIRELEKEQCRM